MIEGSAQDALGERADGIATTRSPRSGAIPRRPSASRSTGANRIFSWQVFERHDGALWGVSEPFKLPDGRDQMLDLTFTRP